MIDVICHKLGLTDMRRDLSTWTDSPRRQFWHPGHQTARRKWKRWWQLWGQLPVPDRSALLQPFPTNKLRLHFSRALTERCCTHKPGLQTKKRCLELCIVAIYCSYSHTFQSHMYSKRTQEYYPRVQLFNTHTLWLSSVWWFMPSIYANYQLRYALLEYRLGCLRGCPGGGVEQIGRTQATHGQLPFE